MLFSVAFQHYSACRGATNLHHNARTLEADSELTRVALERDIPTHYFLAFTDLGAKQGLLLTRHAGALRRASGDSGPGSTVTIDSESERINDTWESTCCQTRSNTILSPCPATTPVVPRL